MRKQLNKPKNLEEFVLKNMNKLNIHQTSPNGFFRGLQGMLEGQNVPVINSPH
jgi:hypothetical protein